MLTFVTLAPAPRSTRHHWGYVPSTAAQRVVRLPSLALATTLPACTELAVAGLPCDRLVCAPAGRPTSTNSKVTTKAVDTRRIATPRISPLLVRYETLASLKRASD